MKVIMIANVAKNLSIKLNEYLIDYDSNGKINIYIIKEKNIADATIFFDLILSNKNNIFLGIDFEFNNLFSKKENRNTRQVALIQINYNDEFIIMFHPDHLKKNQVIKLKNIFFKENTIKILHGGESLDIKYLFENFLDNNKEKMLFLNNFYDTKFICEYLNLTDKKFGLNKKCKIYQLLLKSKIIDNNILNKLENNEKRMGPIYELIVDVNNMSKELIYYTLFDVFYLIKLFKNINLNDEDYQLINYFLHNTLLKRKTIENDLNLLKQYNNSYILLGDNIFTFNYIYHYYEGLFNLKYNFNIINQIPYFKKLLSLIIKKLILHIITDRIPIYKKKNQSINNQIKTLLIHYQFNTDNKYTNEIYKYLINDIDYVI